MKVLIYIFILLSCSSYAQQDAIYSQYLFNPFAINPAYAGSRNSANIVLINRHQWLGLDGAPATQTASAHLPANRKNIAWGINLSHDKLGPARNLYAAGTAAYRLKLNTGNLHFGLRAGIYNSIIDHAILNFREENDALDNQQRLSSIVPSFDFGMYYYTKNFFVGLSVNHITKHRFKYDSFENSQEYYLRRHFFLSSGYVFDINQNVRLKPSILVKYAGPNTFNVDLNVNALFNDTYWVGIGIRNLSSLNFLVDINVTDYLRVGYSYGLTLNKLKNYSNGSHEILVGFDLKTRRQTLISPRYL